LRSAISKYPFFALRQKEVIIPETNQNGEKRTTNAK
jgi:hypothetical protein